MTNESREAGRREEGGTSGRESERGTGPRHSGGPSRLANFVHGLNKVEDEDARHGNCFFRDSVAASWRPGVLARTSEDCCGKPTPAHLAFKRSP